MLDKLVAKIFKALMFCVEMHNKPVLQAFINFSCQKYKVFPPKNQRLAKYTYAVPIGHLSNQSDQSIAAVPIEFLRSVNAFEIVFFSNIFEAGFTSDKY